MGQGIYLKEGEEVDQSYIRVGLHVQLKPGVALIDVAHSIADLLSSTATGDGAAIRTWLLREPSHETIYLAVPAAISRPELGITQILNLLSVPAEYDHCEALVFESIELPARYLEAYVGPRLGVEGIRKRFGVDEGPILGGILKPRLIRDLDAMIAVVRDIARHGLDFVVDDELMVDSEAAPFETRAARIVEALQDHSGRNDRHTAFVANVTARPSDAARFAKQAKELGAGGLVTNPIVAGFGALEDLAASGLELPIFSTNMGTALLAKAPTDGRFAGFTESFVSKLTRLAGADAIHGGIAKASWYATSPTEGAINVLSGNIGAIRPAFRIIAGGLDVLKMIDNWPLDDEPVIFEAGGSIFSHPGGPAAGTQAMRTAWKIAREHMTAEAGSRDRAKVALLRAAERDDALRKAIEATGWQPNETIKQLMRSSPPARKGWFSFLRKGKGR